MDPRGLADPVELVLRIFLHLLGVAYRLENCNICTSHFWGTRENGEEATRAESPLLPILVEVQEALLPVVNEGVPGFACSSAC